MQVTIGMRASARDITVEVDLDEKQVTKLVEGSIKNGGPLDITDTKGRRFLVPAEAIGFVEIGAAEDRRVGFGLT